MGVVISTDKGKARLLLALALTKTTNADEIQRMFDTY
jgi:L-asparaginase/Glu-tRNA(Gln) amidotransferase subunit D